MNYNTLAGRIFNFLTLVRGRLHFETSIAGLSVQKKEAIVLRCLLKRKSSKRLETEMEMDIRSQMTVSLVFTVYP